MQGWDEMESKRDINKPVVSPAENPYDEIQVSPDNARYNLELNKSLSQRKRKAYPHEVEKARTTKKRRK